MHSDVAISVKNLTKTYRLFDHPGDRIKQFLGLGIKQYHREFTALKDVSFDVKKGETVGIIGRNGSGKSTLLQVICGILKPTFGTATASGRISALLELGAGFNPEFTGRENVYFQGALLGLHKDEMDARYSDIAAFADIGDFIEQPVRIYSSGMYLRLAFAVAVNVDAEILVVDEALAVGDAGFRARCLRRIGELRTKGCTILFVSHSLDQIVSLCDRTLLLNRGSLLLVGQSKFAVDRFQQLLRTEPENYEFGNVKSGVSSTVRTDLHLLPSAPTDDHPHSANAIPYEQNGARIESVLLLDAGGQAVVQLCHAQSYQCVFRVNFMLDAANVRFAILLKTLEDIALGGAMSTPSIDKGIESVPRGSVIEVTYNFICRLNPGSYHVNLAVYGSEAGVEYALHGVRAALTFRVSAWPNCPLIGAVDFGFQAAHVFIENR
jgi:lipopolysaccharide transport system ATP-binding protein